MSIPETETSQSEIPDPPPVLTQPDTKLFKQFLAARAAGTPLIAVTTPDVQATQAMLSQPSDKERARRAEKGLHPRISWDCIAGFQALNDEGSIVLSALKPEQVKTVKPTSMLIIAHELPKLTVLFVHNPQRFFDARFPDSHGIIQGIANLRDVYKNTLRSLVLLGHEMPLPGELRRDVLLFDEPLPGDAALSEVILDTYTSFDSEFPTDPASQSPEQQETLRRAVEAVRGLPRFAAEQATAMCISKDGLDIDGLWERKRQMVSQTPGLKVFRGGNTFSDVGGLEYVKWLTGKLKHGKKPPTCIVFIDEIEKHVGHNDTSGVGQDQAGVLLSAMQDNGWTGYLGVGFPGTGKSEIAKSTGNECGVLTISFDLGAMMGSLVGQSQQMIREAIKVLEAVAGDGAFFIGTCNRVADEQGRSLLTPELMRRFTYEKIFFDLPTPEEQAGIVSLLIKKYGLRDDQVGEWLPTNFTGAEIQRTADLAWRLDISLAEAAKEVIPFAQTEAAWVQTLRSQAAGAWKSASYHGAYQMPGGVNATGGQAQPPPTSGKGRMFED